MQSGRRLPWQRRKHKDSCHYSITLHKAIVSFQWEKEAVNSLPPIKCCRQLINFANGLDPDQARKIWVQTVWQPDCIVENNDVKIKLKRIGRREKHDLLPSVLRVNKTM